MGKGTERNSKCSCGSGKKYKKCCMIKANADDPISPQEAERLLREIQAVQGERRKELRALGIFINFVVPKIHLGKKVWAIGSRVYYGRPAEETFHEFSLWILIHQVLGEEWWTTQKDLPESGQHYIYKTFKKYQEWTKETQNEENREGAGWAAVPDGWSRSLLTLAFDVYILLHSQKLPQDLLQRLKSRDGYQAARYEIAVASIFARLGYKIEFLDEKNLREKHCEFYVHDTESGDIIGVEAKSSIRDGVLHQPGTYDGKYWANIRRFYRHAMEQNPGDRPFIIFIDINAPQTDLPAFEKPWTKEVFELHRRQPLHSSELPDPCSGLVFTNYSYHYQEKDQATAGEFLLSVPQHPVFPVRNAHLWENLRLALNNYGNIPNLDVDFGK